MMWTRLSEAGVMRMCPEPVAMLRVTVPLTLRLRSKVPSVEANRELGERMKAAATAAVASAIPECKCREECMGWSPFTRKLRRVTNSYFATSLLLEDDSVSLFEAADYFCAAAV